MRRGWENKRPPCPWSLTPLFLEPYLLLLDLDTLPIVLNTLHAPMELPPPLFLELYYLLLERTLHPAPGAVPLSLELNPLLLKLYILPMELYPLLLSP